MHFKNELYIYVRFVHHNNKIKFHNAWHNQSSRSLLFLGRAMHETAQQMAYLYMCETKTKQQILTKCNANRKIKDEKKRKKIQYPSAVTDLNTRSYSEWTSFFL